MLSGTAEYALRAVVHLAQQAGHRAVPATELARAIDVPPNYLGKVLNELVRARVLRSSRGRGGGFVLAVPPDELPLLRIVERFDAVAERRRCVLGRPECSDRRPCPAHHRWKEAAEAITTFFHETTVADLLG